MSPPLDFSAIKKQEETPSTAAKPLDFGQVNRPSPSPAPPQKLAALPLPLPPRAPAKLPLGEVPVQPRAAPLDLQQVRVPPMRVGVLPVNVSPPGSLAAEAFKEAVRLYPEIATANQPKIDAHLKQLLPMKIETIVDWGDKHATTSSKVASDVAAVVRQVSDAKLPELIAAATEAVTATPSLLKRLISSDVVSYKPRLIAARMNLDRWFPELNGLKVAADEAHDKISVYMVSLSAAVAYVGVIADNSFDRVVHQRQMFLQQVSQQAVFTVAQLKDQLDNLYAVKAGLDQLLDVTIPAYQNAKSH